MLLPFFLLLMLSISWAGNQYFLEFDGSNDYVLYKDDAALGKLDGATEFTIEAWIYVLPGWEDYDRIVQRYSCWALRIRSDNKIEFAMDHGVSDWAHYLTVANVFNENEWTHIAVIRNTEPDPNELKIYVNGVDKTDRTWSGYPMVNEDSRDLFIGQLGDNGNYFNGYIDEIRLKNVAEDPNNLHFHKNDPEYESDANTAALFHFNEGSGQYTVNEASGANARLGSSTSSDASDPTWRVWNYNGSDLSLPVELTSFTAAYASNAVILRWQTASEVNNLGFVILRSLTGNDPFQEIASYQNTPALRGAGNSSRAHSYAYTDYQVVPETQYWYKLVNVDFNGTRTEHPAISVKTTANGSGAISHTGNTLPEKYALYQNYPNPFNPETKIEFDIPSKEDNQVFVTLSVFDINGKKVKTLFKGLAEAGHYSVKWNGTNDKGQKLNSGMYFLQFKTPSYFKTIKMVMMR